MVSRVPFCLSLTSPIPIRFSVSPCLTDPSRLFFQHHSRTNMPVKGILFSYTLHQHWRWWDSCAVLSMGEKGTDSHTSHSSVLQARVCRTGSWNMASDLYTEQIWYKRHKRNFHTVSPCNFCCPVSENCNLSLKVSSHPDPDFIVSK